MTEKCKYKGISCLTICTLIGVHSKFYTIYRQEGSFENKSGLDIVKDSWYDTYEKLREYAKENSMLPPITNKNRYERDLGKWCSYQRVAKQQKRLSDERIKLLEAIPEWYWDNKGMWEVNYQKVMNFVKTYGHLPRRVGIRRSEFLVSTEEERLERWCRRMREIYGGDKNGTLDKERIEKLEQIPGWFWNTPKWDNRFNAYKHFVTKNNRHPGASTKDKSELVLYQWAYRQKSIKSKLSSDKIKKLESLPKWSWEHSLKQKTPWDTSYNKIIAFVGKNYRLPDRKKKHDDDLNLVQWCERQRYRRKQLSADKIIKIEKIPGWQW